MYKNLCFWQLGELISWTLCWQKSKLKIKFLILFKSYNCLILCPAISLSQQNLPLLNSASAQEAVHITKYSLVKGIHVLTKGLQIWNSWARHVFPGSLSCEHQIRMTTEQQKNYKKSQTKDKHCKYEETIGKEPRQPSLLVYKSIPKEKENKSFNY